MRGRFLLSGALLAALVITGPALTGPASGAGLKVTSDIIVPGFKFPESAAYDPNANALFVSEFVS